MLTSDSNGQALRLPLAVFRAKRSYTLGFLFLGLLSLIALWLVLTLKTISILADGREITLKTRVGTVTEALKQAGIKLGPKDVVEPDVSRRLANQMAIRVNRAVSVSLEADGFGQVILSAGGTVKDVLAETGVTLGQADRIAPALETALLPGMRIRVVRVREEVATQQVELPYRLERHEDTTLDAGQIRLLQKGEAGLKEVIYHTIYEDGKKIKSEIQGERVIKEPITEIVAYGTAGTISRGGRTIRFKKVIDMVATAYTAGPESTGPYATGYTSTGVRATYGIVAVDPRIIPLHSRLYVDGYGFAVAEDTGGAIKGNRIDLCYDSVQEALDWGRQRVKVYVLD